MPMPTAIGLTPTEALPQILSLLSPKATCPSWNPPTTGTEFGICKAALTNPSKSVLFSSRFCPMNILALPMMTFSPITSISIAAETNQGVTHCALICPFVIIGFPLYPSAPLNSIPVILRSISILPSNVAGD